MSSKKIVLIPIIVVVLAYLLIGTTLNLLNWNNRKDSITQDLKNRFTVDAQIKGDVDFSFFPVPKITLNGLEIYNDSSKVSKILTADYAVFKVNLLSFSPFSFNIFKIFSNQLIFSKIRLYNPQLYFSYGKDSLISFFSRVIPVDNYLENIVAYDLKINAVNTKNVVTNTLSLGDIRCKLNSKQGNMKFNFELPNNVVIQKLDIDLNNRSNNKTVNIVSSGPSLSLDFVGTISPDSSIKGQLKGKIIDQNIISSAFFDIFRFADSIKKYKFHNDIKVDGDLSIKDNDIGFVINNIEAKDEVLGKGNFQISLKDNPALDLNLNFDKIILDPKVISSENDSNDLSSNFSNKTRFLHVEENYNYDLNLNIASNSIVYGQDTYSNSSLVMTVTNGKLKINNISTIMPGQVNLKIANIVSQNYGSDMALVGNVNLNGDNFSKTIVDFGLKNLLNNSNLKQYNITSDFLVSSYGLAFFNSKLNFDNTSLSGKVLLSQEDKMDIKIFIDGSGLNLSDFTVPLLQQRIKDFFCNTANASYVSDFKWFRDINRRFHFNINIKDSSIDNNKINSLKTNFDIGQGYLTVKAVDLDSDFAQLKGAFNIDFNSLRPSLNVNLSGPNFDVSKFYKLLNIPVAQAANSNYLLELPISDIDFNLFRIDKFDGRIDLDIDKMVFAQYPITKLLVNSHFANEILYLELVQLGMFNGNLEVKGNFNYLDKKTLTVGFALNNFDLENFSNYFIGYSPVIGKASANGIFVSKGSNLKDILASCSSPNIDVKASDFVFNNVDIEMIRYIFSEKLKNHNVKEIEASILQALSSGKTSFNQLDGKIKIEQGKMNLSTTFKTKNNDIYGACAADIDLDAAALAAQANFSFIPVNQNSQVNTLVTVQGSISEPTKSYDYSSMLPMLNSYFVVGKEEKKAEELTKEQQDIVQTLKELKENK